MYKIFQTLKKKVKKIVSLQEIQQIKYRERTNT